MDVNGDGVVDIADIIILELKTPGIRVDRAAFLSNEFIRHYTGDVIQDAILFNPMHGGIGPGSMKREFLQSRGLSEQGRQRFRRDLEVLRDIPIDVVLGNHPYQNNTVEKLILRKNGREEAFIDSDEWRSLMDKYAEMYDDMIISEQT